ncbi:MAG: spondin domain-containing protein [Vicinamibacterales bacterium]
MTAATAPALAQSTARYRVTVTNLTKGQTFTPILIATHSPATRIFAAGTQTSPQLQILAEEGETAMLAALLRGTTTVGEVVTGPAPLAGLQTPATNRSYDISAGSAFTQLSLVAMLIPTNDAFVGANSLTLPSGFDPLVVDLLAYDAGTEVNDEQCASIPGPSFTECGGPGGGGRPGRGEGAITVHNGMHGVGTMSAALRDWRGAVARVTIQRVQ